MPNRHNQWRKRHPKVRNSCRARNYAKSKPPAEIAKRRPTGIKHLPWGELEKVLIFMDEYSDQKLAMFLGRSVQAIQTMRWKVLRALK